MSRSDFTAAEEAHVRTALRFARSRCGTWGNVSRAMRVEWRTLTRIVAGGAVSAVVAVRLAKLMGTGVDDVLTGKWPPIRVCSMCGQQVRTEEAS